MIKSVFNQKKYLQPKEIIMCYIIFGIKALVDTVGIRSTELKDKILF